MITSSSEIPFNAYTLPTQRLQHVCFTGWEVYALRVFFFFLEQDLYHAYPVYHFVTAGKDLDDLDHDDLSDERGLVGISPVP